MIKRLRGFAQSGSLWWGQCLLCRQDCRQQPLICRQCREELPELEHPCPLCAFPLPRPGATCGHCQRHPPAWDRMRVLADYEYPFEQLIQRLKYQRQRLAGRLLGQLLAERISPPLPEAILPVPLHWWRRWRRGYNQAEEIARGLASRLPVNIDCHSLRRIRATPAQARLSRTRRRQNLRRAFQLSPVHYRHVALVDDVITTGSTMNELTGLLRRQGVAVIEVWALCRTLEH
ncbi:ComF family protein [Zobellella maritima]|uniref:ComF family protein n=1 Tax=Zobellella maritima TaxID=2059725 RepID=UPI000E307981|nr:ComF family protein [Zobellella maritima]